MALDVFCIVVIIWHWFRVSPNRFHLNFWLYEYISSLPPFIVHEKFLSLINYCVTSLPARNNNPAIQSFTIIGSTKSTFLDLYIYRHENFSTYQDSKFGNQIGFSTRAISFLVKKISSPAVRTCDQTADEETSNSSTRANLILSNLTLPQFKSAQKFSYH